MSLVVVIVGGLILFEIVGVCMSASIDIPSMWTLSDDSDGSVSAEGESIAFVHKNAPLRVSVSGVKEVSDRLDFLGVVENTETGETLENLWLASNDFPTVSHTREEVFKEVEGWLKSYTHF